MDYDSLAKIGSMLGSGGMVVLDETTDMVKFALRIMRFYAHESCGWCIPCREGTTWLRKILQRFDDGGGRHEDVALLGELSKNMLGRTFCALGDAAAMPTISIVEKFADDFEKRLGADRQMVAGLSMAELVNLTINGQAIQAEKGTLLIEVARQNGIEIPAFCYYEGLTLQAACRMCLVEVEKTPKLQVGCTLPVADGMVVHTESDTVHAGAQGHARVPADQPSAGLPGVRQGRRVRTAGHGVPLRRGREPLHRAEAARGRAAVVAGGVFRRAALHPVLSLRARLQ